MNVIKEVGKMGWEAVTALQQLCILRKSQLRALEDSVYVIRKNQSYLAYKGDTEFWAPLNDAGLAVYPSFVTADYMRGKLEGSTVVKIMKTEFVTLPCFVVYLKEQLVDVRGNWLG